MEHEVLYASTILATACHRWMLNQDIRLCFLVSKGFLDKKNLSAVGPWKQLILGWVEVNLAIHICSISLIGNSHMFSPLSKIECEWIFNEEWNQIVEQNKIEFNKNGIAKNKIELTYGWSPKLSYVIYLMKNDIILCKSHRFHVGIWTSHVYLILLKFGWDHLCLLLFQLLLYTHDTSTSDTSSLMFVCM